jgi:RNA polymerase sigma-70 factor (ECF subfamily)
MTDQARTDHDLMRAFQQGSVDAFEELFRRYERPIWGYFRRRTADAGRAQELTQDTFLAVLKGAAAYQPTASFRTYLYAIAFNILSADRRRARVAASFDRPAGEAWRPSIEDDVWMRQAVARLDEVDRAVIMLREFEDLSYAEIAGVLKVPVNTVRSRLFRAREALREQLKPVTVAKGHAS